MRSALLRTLAAAVVVTGSSLAFAESYTAFVYSVPAGYERMFVAGAGVTP
jgi:hypothetical protein